ncbi:hypothetical protein F5X99DRAFT_397753 [Biscogniauxia marginata]|nr:hypothetical protein F5X99DRAFT_397753 [Biscogniauxia marginata]
MRISTIYYLQTLVALISAQLVALPYGIHPKPHYQQPLMDNAGPALPPSNKPSNSEQPAPPRGGVLISDVMGRDRSINIFASFTRDVASISNRLDSSSQNSTVLAPLNSAVDKLPRKPWEDPKEYEAFGTNAYEGDDGQSRAQRNLRRFVEAHVVTMSPWPENEKAKTLLDGDREIWWEVKDGIKVLQPDGIEIQGIASRVGNGELWILKAVRNYT